MTSRRSARSAGPARRAACALTAGAAAGVLAAIIGPWWLGPLVAWDVAATVQLVWTWLLIWGLSASETSAHATKESPGRANTDLLLLAGSIVSLAAVGLVLVKANQHAGLDKGVLVGTSVLSIVLAWSTVHTVLRAAIPAPSSTTAAKPAASISTTHTRRATPTSHTSR